MQRYFAIDKKETEFLLEQSDYYHIKTVMRMKEKDKIEVVYEQQLYLCSIIDVETNMKVIIQEKQTIIEDFMKPVVLIVPILKEQKMDFILQKATELGVTEIVPVEMKRCVVKVDKAKEAKKIERWRKIIKEASEQSKRHSLPSLHSVVTLDELKTYKGTKIICSTVEKENSIKKFLQTNQKYDKLYIVIGPEGGLDPNEEKELIQSGFVPVSLGPRIMRVETVPIYLLSILNYEYME